ncbi:unnamed protein product, partial [Brassica oleracea]
MKVGEHVLQTQHVLETKQKGNTWLTETSPNFTALKVMIHENKYKTEPGKERIKLDQFIEGEDEKARVVAGQDCVMRTTYLPESEAGQDSALEATACQKHSPNVGSQAPVTDPASLTEPLSLKDKGKKPERDHSASLSQSSISVKSLGERTERREKV